MQYFCDVLREPDNIFYAERLKKRKNFSLFEKNDEKLKHDSPSDAHYGECLTVENLTGLTTTERTPKNCLPTGRPLDQFEHCAGAKNRWRRVVVN